jgi:hypothetical protein
VPFIRYSRDKRGYENTFVMHAYRPGQGPQRARVLYLFRTPAHVKIGRKALEPEVMEALEHTHPDLSFDWTNVQTERTSEMPDSREGRDGRDRDRRDRFRDRGPDRQPQRPAATPPPAPVIDDESLLGRTVGAERAARLRGRYQELVERIGRRARTPEDRDRLMDRMQRLNPDEWGDEQAIRAAVATVEAEWDTLATELPSRRRGRRGGRHRQHGAVHDQRAPGLPPEAQDSSPSVIIEDDSYEDAEHAMGARDLLARSGDDGGVGATSAEPTSEPAGADETGDAAGTGDLPGDR